MTLWTPAEITFLSEQLQEPTKEIYGNFCDQYGSCRSYDSVQKKIKKLRDAFSDADENNEGDETLSDELEGFLGIPTPGQVLFTPHVTTEKKTRSKEEAKAWLTELVEAASQLDLSGPSHATAVVGDKASLVIVLSDTHFGKHTKAFSLGTAYDRLLSMPDLIVAKGATPPIDEVVVLLVGDMVEGEDIYATQSNHIECSAIEQVQACSRAIWHFLLKLQEVFKVKVRVETVPGNHGRVSKTANEQTNWDNVVYHILNVMANMRDDEDLVVNCNFHTFHTFPVKDKTGLIYHHGVKHTGTSAMREKVAGWAHGKKFDFLVHGHWHEWHVGNWLGKFVVGNGCLCGPDDLAERMGKEDIARQAYFFVSPEKPVWGFSFVEWE